MDRRRALRLGAGALAAGSAGVLTLASGFKPDLPPLAEPKKVEYDETKSSYGYTSLDPDATALLAYNNYPKGSCMYGVFSSIVEQLGEKIGEPFRSFPVHMMKYGHGGIGGAGSVCGAANGAAAVMGLLIDDNKTRDALTAELFRWYETGEFPAYKPSEPGFDYTPPASVSKSILCHASTTRWAINAEQRIDSKERKERCRRLTADVAAKTTEILNSYFENTYVTAYHENRVAANCTSCHGSKGKVANTSVKMDCNSCHEKSLGHKLFGDVHYKLMKKK